MVFCKCKLQYFYMSYSILYTLQYRVHVGMNEVVEEDAPSVEPGRDGVGVEGVHHGKDVVIPMQKQQWSFPEDLIKEFVSINEK